MRIKNPAASDKLFHEPIVLKVLSEKRAPAQASHPIADKSDPTIRIIMPKNIPEKILKSEEVLLNTIPIIKK